MNFEQFIAFRYLRSPRSDKSISLITIVSIIGVALGVSVLIVVLSVMNGFERDLRSALIGVNAHISIGKYKIVDSKPLTFDDKVVANIKSEIPYKAIVPYTMNQALVNSEEYPKGVLVRGIDPDTEIAYPVISKYFFFDHEDREPSSLSKIEEIIKSLSVQEAEIERYKNIKKNTVQVSKEKVYLPGIILGSSLANEISVKTGDTVELIALLERISPLGSLPKMKRFQIRGIFRSGLSGYDDIMAFIDMSFAQKFFLKNDQITGISVFIDNPEEAQIYQEKLRDKITIPYYVRSWIDDNANLFSVIQLEKFGLALILTLVILIAAFNIIASLIILVIEKKKDIAILKTMGAKNSSIRRIFVMQGIIIGFSGTFLGEIIGVIISLIIKNYEVVKIPEGVYVANKIPLYIEPSQLLLIGFVSMIICFLVTIYPSTKATRFLPAESLRND